MPAPVAPWRPAQIATTSFGEPDAAPQHSAEAQVALAAEAEAAAEAAAQAEAEAAAQAEAEAAAQAEAEAAAQAEAEAEADLPPLASTLAELDGAVPVRAAPVTRARG